MGWQGYLPRQIFLICPLVKRGLFATKMQKQLTMRVMNMAKIEPYKDEKRNLKYE